MKLVVAAVLLMAAASMAAPASERFDHRPVLSSVCENMTPGHGNAKPNTEPSPYTVTVEPISVNGGDQVTVHITGTEGFKGVYMQARQGDEPVGEFLRPNPDTEEIVISDCTPGQKNAYTYITYDKPLRSLDVNWKAPNINGEIVFKVTFVKDFRTFWVGVPSPTVTITKTKATDNAVAA